MSISFRTTAGADMHERHEDSRPGARAATSKKDQRKVLCAGETRAKGILPPISAQPQPVASCQCVPRSAYNTARYCKFKVYSSHVKLSPLRPASQSSDQRYLILSGSPLAYVKQTLLLWRRGVTPHHPSPVSTPVKRNSSPPIILHL